MSRRVIDTNIFNRLVDGDIDTSELPAGEYLVTAWQESELSSTRSAPRRSQLLSLFRRASPKSIDARSTPWGSPWGSPWDQGGEFYDKIFAALEKLKPKDRGNMGDAVNIEAALYEKAEFLSDDKAAREVAQQFGVSAKSLNELLGP